MPEDVEAFPKPSAQLIEAGSALVQGLQTVYGCFPLLKNTFLFDKPWIISTLQFLAASNGRKLAKTMLKIAIPVTGLASQIGHRSLAEVEACAGDSPGLLGSLA